MSHPPRGTASAPSNARRLTRRAGFAVGLGADLVMCLTLFSIVRCARDTDCTIGRPLWLMLVIAPVVAVIAGAFGGVWVYIGLMLACGVGPFIAALSTDGLHSFLWATGLPGLWIGLGMAWEERHPAPPPPAPSVLLEQFVSYPAAESLLTEGTWAVVRVLEVVDEHGEKEDGRPAVTLRVNVRPLDGAPPFDTRLQTNVALDAFPHAGDRYLARYRPGAPMSAALLRPRLPDAPDPSIASAATPGAGALTIDAPVYNDFIRHIRWSERRVRVLLPIGRLLLVVGLGLLIAWLFGPLGPWPAGVVLVTSIVVIGYAAEMPHFRSIGDIARSTYEKPRINLFALVASGHPAVAVILDTRQSGASDGTPMVRLRVRLEPLDQPHPRAVVEAERLVAMRRLSVPRLGERFAAIYNPDHPEHFVLTSPTPLPPAAQQPPTAQAPARISRSLLMSRLDRLSDERLTGELSEAEFTQRKTDLLNEAYYSASSSSTGYKTEPMHVIFELVDRLGSGFDRGGAGEAEQAQDFDRSVGGLGGGGGSLGEYGAGGGDGVHRVGFAVAASGGPVGAVDLGHGDLVAAEVAVQGHTVGAGAFHTGSVQDAEAAGPGQEFPVAGGGGGECGVGELGAEGGDDRGDVGVFVGVNAEDDLLRFRFGLVGLSGGVWVGHSGHWRVRPLDGWADGHRRTGGRSEL